MHPQTNKLRLITSAFFLGHIVAGCALSAQPSRQSQKPSRQPQMGTRSIPLLSVDGLRFRDLNRDGKLQPFEDWRLAPRQRAEDLVVRLSLEEKAGLMMHASAPAEGSATVGRGKEYDLPKADELIERRKVTTFITRLTGEAHDLAGQNNLLQEQAERTRFAIPLTISTDPRNSFTSTVGASNEAGGFSQWPDMTGMGALNQPEETRRFGDMARREYLAVGITEALSPQADLATDPRWPRIDGTFGEDPQRVKAMVEAYVAGFQEGEEGLHPGSVLCVVKHWAGYGAMKDGWDGHNSYGRHAAFPGQDFAEHLTPFEGAFAAKVAGVMPTYAILDGVQVNGKALEPVAAGFSKQLLTDLLRDRYRFDGVVLSDWLITSDCRGECLNGAAPGVAPGITPGEFGMPWGVETLTPEQRYAKALAAGVDQFGGVADSDLIVKLVNAGEVSEQRINESAVRILAQKFALGLFENPYVDPERASSIVGQPEFRRAALAAQERSMVLLSNGGAGHLGEPGKPFLPLRSSMHKVFLVGVAAESARDAGLQPVNDPAGADFAVVRLHAPYQMLHPGYFFGSRQHEGDLDFKAEDPDFIAFDKLARKLPTVAAVFLDRPAILTPIVDHAAAVLANFGASDRALLAVLTGRAAPEGSLPFELPRSMEAVRTQKGDVPHDSASPLFALGFGMHYLGSAPAGTPGSPAR